MTRIDTTPTRYDAQKWRLVARTAVAQTKIFDIRIEGMDLNDAVWARKQMEQRWPHLAWEFVSTEND